MAAIFRQRGFAVGFLITLLSGIIASFSLWLNGNNTNIEEILLNIRNWLTFYQPTMTIILFFLIFLLFIATSIGSRIETAFPAGGSQDRARNNFRLCITLVMFFVIIIIATLAFAMYVPATPTIGVLALFSAFAAMVFSRY